MMNQMENHKKTEYQISVEEINRCVLYDTEEYIAECERNHRDRIYSAAQAIMEGASERRIVLVSGPSGSGKTSTALQIEHLLDQWGIESHTISMDNYFLDVEEETVPRDEKGNPDLESPLCMDVELLNRHVGMLASGQGIDVPTFDFERQKRSGETVRCAPQKGEIVVFEGIHALNPQILNGVEQYATRVYISVQSGIVLPDGKVFGPEHIRVMRRIIRDFIHRGRSAIETIEAWDSVRRGELNYILPHKGNADISIDTMLPYEACVTAHMAFDLMNKDMARIKSKAEAQLLFKTAPMFETILPEQVPMTSLLKEFIV